MSISTCVIGAGISGLSLASMLRENNIKCLVFEKASKIGGLVSCTRENDVLFHRVGGHVFNSKSSAVNNWFWKKFDRDTQFIKACRKAVIYMSRDSIVDYPIELSLNQLGISVSDQVVDELIDLVKSEDCLPKAKSFGEFLQRNFGSTLSSIYFIPYNRKIWKKDLNSIPLEWLEGKLPMIKPSDILRKNIATSADDMVHSSFYYPKKNGSQFIVDRLGQDLDIRNEHTTQIEKHGHQLLLNGKYLCNNIVYTGDIRDLPSLLGPNISKRLSCSISLDSIRHLCSNGTSTMLCECDKNPYSWIYFPDEAFKIHRAIMTGNFSSHNNGHNSSNHRITCTVEASGFYEKDRMEDEIKRLPFRMQPLAYNYCATSYIIHDCFTAETINSVKSALENENIFLCGRLAEWCYYNMDTAIESAMKLASRLVQETRCIGS